MPTRLSYYLGSIPTLLGGYQNPTALLSAALGSHPTLHLKNGPRFKVRSLMDAWIIKETCLDKDYEVHGTPIQDNWVVADIGAGLGDFTLMTAHAHPTARVFAYEPFAESFALLQHNIQLNGVTNVQTRPVAVGAQRGQKVLATTGAAVQHTTTDSTLSGEATAQMTVQAITLNDLLAEVGGHCDFLKMDCEGGEFEILLNASCETLRQFSHICMEYHDGFTPYSHKDLAQHLQGCGFEVRTAANPVHGFLGFLYGQLVTLPTSTSQ
jgi:FkbM family methyltransferase